MEELTRLEIIHLVDVSLGELEFQLSKGRQSLVAAEKKAYFRTMTGFLLYWVSLLLNVINGCLQQLYLKIKEAKEAREEIIGEVDDWCLSYPEDNEDKSNY